MTTLEVIFASLSTHAAQASPSIAKANCWPATFSEFRKLYSTKVLPADHLQHHLSVLQSKDNLENLMAVVTDPADRARLSSLKHRNPYPNFNLADTMLHTAPSQHRLIMRHRRGLHPSHVITVSPAATCTCGATLAFDKHHFTSCKVFSAQCIQAHNDAYRTIQNNMLLCGLSSLHEQPVGHNQLRSDITVRFPQDGQVMHIDFSCTNPAAKSISVGPARERAYGAILAREKTKIDKYDDHVRASGGIFEPWVVDSFGTCSDTVIRLTKKIHDAATLERVPNPPSRKTMLDRVAHKVFLGTANINGAGLARMAANNAHARG
jgi:hypothetical protein